MGIERLNRRHGLLCASAMSLIALPEAAMAQQEKPAAAAPAPLVVEDIVVTARKREESLQQVPITATAFTSDSIERAGIQTLDEVAQLTPSLSFENIGIRSSEKPVIRGLSTASVVASQQKSSVFVDGVYVAGSYSSIPLSNLARVEVLKGPQSAFFGRSTFAGAINYVTLDPGSAWSGKASLSAAGNDEYEANAFAGGPIVGDTVLLQLAGYYLDYRAPDAWVNRADGHRIGSQQTKSGSATLLLRPSESLTLRGRILYGEDEDGHNNSLFGLLANRTGRFVKPNGQVVFYPVGEQSIEPPNYVRNLQNLPNPGLRRNLFRSSLQADFTIANHDVTALGAYNKEDTEIETDFDFSSSDILFTTARGVTKDKSFELRVNSPRQQPLRYMFGGYHLDLDLATSGIFGNNVTGLRTPSDIITATRNNSIFGATYLDIGKAVTLSFEGRLQSDKISSRNRLTGLFLEKTFVSFLPRFNVEFRASNEITIYGVYSKGNNPGTFNTATGLSPDQRIVDEEKLTNYEVGVKSRLLGGRLVLNAAAYRMNWSDMQFTRSVTTSLGSLTVITVNEGSSRVNGAELEATVVPARGADVRLTLSWNDARYRDYCSTNLFNLLGKSDIPGGNCVFVDGNRLEAEPRWQSSLSGGYEGALAGRWRWFAHGEVAYQGRKYESEMNLAWIGSAVVAGGRIGVRDDRIRLELFGRNLTNETTPARIVRLSDNRVAGGTAFNQNVAFIRRKPRQYGIRASARF